MLETHGAPPGLPPVGYPPPPPPLLRSAWALQQAHLPEGQVAPHRMPELIFVLLRGKDLEVDVPPGLGGKPELAVSKFRGRSHMCVGPGYRIAFSLLGGRSRSICGQVACP